MTKVNYTSIGSRDANDLATKAFLFFARHNISLANGLVIAVSGGSDSIVLLDVLAKMKIPVVAAHCNFQLRERESDGDELFVADIAKKLNVPFHSVRFDTTGIAAEQKESIQIAARRLRYNWLEELRHEIGYAYIATAHHAVDNAETILQHIIDGTGLSGLRGIPPINGFIVRPFLQVTKSEILKYAVAHNLSFRTDSSNEKTNYTRNKIRLELLPKLTELNPSIVSTLNQNANRWQQAFEIYHQAVEKTKRRLIEKHNDAHFINIGKLLNSTSANTILFELLKDFGFNTDQSNEIFESLYTESGKTFYSGTHRVIKDRTQLIITSVDAKTFHHTIENKSARLDLPTGKLHIESIPNSPKINFSSDHYQYVDADSLQFPLMLRPWKKGDYFYPFGLNKKKKLSDYFTDHKFSLLDKEQQPVLFSGEHVIAIPRLTIDHRFQVKPTTKKVLKISWVKS